jgi:hypothetical protein
MPIGQNVSKGEDAMNMAFIVARHGTCVQETGKLDYTGREQTLQVGLVAWEVARKLDLKISLLCSMAPPVLQAGGLLAALLELADDQLIVRESLWIDHTHEGDLRAVEELVGAYLREGNLVLVISHLSVVSPIAVYAARSIQAPGIADITPEVEPGHGWIVTTEGISRVP